MLTPLPTPPPSDLQPRLQRLLASAGAVVLVSLFGFALIGVTSSDDDPAVVASPQPSPTTPDTASPGDGATADASATPSVEPSASSPAATATPSVTAVPSPEPSATPDPTPTSTPEPSPTPTPTPTPSDDGRIDPGSISVQVLDGVLDDNRAAANRVADRLEAAGYRVIVVNSASIRYDQTTAMYTEGFQAQGEQIADEFGFLVRPKPGNLSSSVQVHVVVGLDEAS